MIKQAKFIVWLTLFSLSLVLHSPNVRAAETIRMIAVDSYSSSSLWVKVFIEYFIPEVDKRLAEKDNYVIDWNPAFGGTIAKTKGVLDSLQHDLGDIGIITTPYHADKLPFYNLPYSTPFVTSDVGLIARTMSDLHDKYPELREGWDEYEIHYLVTAGNIDSYGLLMTDPIESFADLGGKKIGGVGSNLTFLEGSGAARVASGLSDWYNNMATGLLNGIIVWPEAVLAYRLFEVAPYMLDIQFGGATSKAVVFNKKRWDRLPEEIQIVLQEVAIDYRDELARVTDEISAHAREEFVKNGGTIIPVTPQQRQEWASKLDDLAALWLSLMEKKGLPGEQILADYMQTMRNNNQPIMRNWGREKMSATENIMLEQTAIGRLFHKWVFALNSIGTLWILAIMVLMNTDIFMRFIFGAPIDGVTEIIELSIAGIVFLQLADAVRAGRLTRSDGLYNRLAVNRPKLGHILGFFFDLCGAVFFICILMGGIPMFIDAWVGNEYAGVDGVFTVILWPIRFIMVVSCISVIGVFISFMINHILALKAINSRQTSTTQGGAA